jgi:hypothetical protein
MGLRPPFETFAKATCKGSYVLRSACGNCERCTWERSLPGFAAPLEPFVYASRQRKTREDGAREAAVNCVRHLSAMGLPEDALLKAVAAVEASINNHHERFMAGEWDR